MEALIEDDGAVSIRLSSAEAVVLHYVIAYAEFDNDLNEIELKQPVEHKVFSDLQQSLVPCIPTLGTDGYHATVTHAYAAIDPRPF